MRRWGIPLYVDGIPSALTTLFLESSEKILKSLGLIAIALIVMYSVRTLCRWYVTYQGHMMGARMESGMHHDLFEKFEAYSFSYYDTHNTGEMMSKLYVILDLLIYKCYILFR